MQGMEVPNVLRDNNQAFDEINSACLNLEGKTTQRSFQVPHAQLSNVHMTGL